MRVAALLLLVLATAGSVAACASSSKSIASGGSTPASSRNGFAAYTDCLRKNGVALPSGRASRPTARPTARPSGGFRGGFGFGNQPPAGVDPQTWQKAQQACQALRPTAGPGGAGGRNSGAFTA